MFVRRVDRIELMLQNLINQTGLQHADLKTNIQDLRTEIVRLDREMQNVKERLRVMEEKTK
jgi:regulator of replication initiation timing